MAKHFLPKDPTDLVGNCLKAYVYENDALSLLEKEKVVFNNRHDPQKVSLISGGGSGHEPGWVGFVGSGMLTATAQGDIFASPNYNNVKAAEKVVHSEAGTIFLITNYTGDNLYFGMAAQDLISRFGDKVRLLRTTDDVSIGRTSGELVGRRTLAGCIFAIKLLGAASERGYDIDTLCELGESINKSTVSVNAGLDHVHIPGHPADSNYGKLDPNQMELGLGIHNEPGLTKIDEVLPNEVLIPKMLQLMLDKSDKERNFLEYDKNDKFILLFNNLGGVPVIEEKALIYTIVKELQSIYGIVPSRVYSGHFITSINAPIFTISLLNITKAVNKTFSEKTLFALLDDPNGSSSFPVCHNTGESILNAHKRIITNFENYPESDEVQAKEDISCDSALIRSILRKGAENVLARESDITFWDTEMGDGDCGKTLEAGALGILRGLDSGAINCTGILSTLEGILHVLKYDMGGTLGAILFIFTKSLINRSELLIRKGKKDAADIFAIALEEAVKTLGEFTKAREGHRTVMDVLIPFCREFSQSKDIVAAVTTAKEAAEGTRKLKPKLGRATYVGSSKERVDFPPDPGAYGLYEILSALNSQQA
ncbi:Piso0_003696 [Millerozyma farinosa CBS 7064]|uniref:Piso0_003696 protein n=1 Tax=Pichia sorbitophila (strain ATCC MYA-4447 / BCRC 22081 / CBS 7064 / NBRC 10061 / NRRL Y-12695) TaxID=559304 RepID=G8YAS0_PICSO|nr:Piso0_003696 [Millerozyma farinosa CBS 7064]CCE84155.1 Piso0_003696 [Millerozyma farinosa CBS 7064]